MRRSLSSKVRTPSPEDEAPRGKHLLQRGVHLSLLRFEFTPVVPNLDRHVTLSLHAGDQLERLGIGLKVCREGVGASGSDGSCYLFEEEGKRVRGRDDPLLSFVRRARTVSSTGLSVGGVNTAVEERRDLAEPRTCRLLQYSVSNPKWPTRDRPPGYVASKLKDDSTSPWWSLTRARDLRWRFSVEETADGDRVKGPRSLIAPPPKALPVSKVGGIEWWK